VRFINRLWLAVYRLTLLYIALPCVADDSSVRLRGSRNFRAKGTFAPRRESSPVPGLGLGIGIGLRLGLWLCSLARKFTGKKVLRRESSLGTKVP